MNLQDIPQANDYLDSVIKTHPVVYVTRDVERALGICPSINFSIITNNTPLAQELEDKFGKEAIIIIDDKKYLDTQDLLQNDKTIEMVKKRGASVLVFKNTPQVEEICRKNDLPLLNPSANFAEKLENKITQEIWLNGLSELLPPHITAIIGEIEWHQIEKKFNKNNNYNPPIVLQWAHGNTGNSSYLIKEKGEFDRFKKTYPKREARISIYINGPSFTSNICVSKEKIYFGNISQQITGFVPFTNSIFATIGNDWSSPYSLLSEQQISDYNQIAEKVAEKMKNENWKGLFGIDVIFDKERNKLYLLEINSRQPASAVYESWLQAQVSEGITIFEAHLESLLNVNDNRDFVFINDGSQIIQRSFKERDEFLNENKIKEIESKLKEIGMGVIVYPKLNKENSDLIRIQCKRGIMENESKFNERGKRILQIVS